MYQTSLPQQYTLPPPPQDSDSVALTTDRLRSAAAMIQARSIFRSSMYADTRSGQMTGNQTDVLSEHQSRRGASKMPSQTRLRAYRAAAPYSTSTPSHTGSQTSQGAHSYHTGSQVSHTTHTSDVPEVNEDDASLTSAKVRARRGTHGQGGRSTRKLDENTQEILLYARAAMVNEMLLNLGWCEGEEGHRRRIKTARECFAQAVAALGKSHEGQFK
jgi:hypothetical protein